MEEIEKLIDDILRERIGKFDWYKSEEGKKILRIKEIINSMKDEERSSVL